MKIEKLLCVGLGLIMLLACKPEQPSDLFVTGAPVQVSLPETEASCVYLSDDESGNLVMSWVEVDSSGGKTLRITFWEEKTGAFSDTSSFSLPDHTSVHEEGMPKIAVTGDGTLMVFFEVSESSPHSVWGVSDIWYVSSSDRGRSWSSVRPVFPGKPENSSVSFSGVARLADGTVGIGWLGTDSDPEASGRPIYFARTTGEDEFGRPVLVDPSACECCRVAVSGSEDGKVMVAYRDLLPGPVRDISLAVSRDGGAHFDSPVPFSNDGWQVDGCPHNGPSVRMDSEKIYAAWFTNGSEPGVHLAEMDVTGKVISRTLLSSSAQFVQMTDLTSGGIAAVYNEDYENEGRMLSRIRLARVAGEEIEYQEVTLPGARAAYPVVRSAGTEDIVVAWREEGAVYYRKMKSRP